MNSGISFKKNRREFIRTVSGLGLTAAGLFSLGAVSSCSTLDEYLIEDPSKFDQEVIIVGAGIGGLYAAYQLKKNRIPFRIFEASSRLGGRILTTGDIEWGASEFSNNDRVLINLAKELRLDRQKLDSESWIFKKGSASLTEGVTDIVKGLLPNRQIRTQHRLISCRQIGDVYQLDFRGPNRERSYFANKVLLALPATAYKNIRGLQDIQATRKLYDRLTSAKTNEMVRVVLPAPKDFKLKSNYLTEIETHLKLSQRVQKNNLLFTFESPADQPFRKLAEIEKYLNQNLYFHPRSKLSLKDDQIFDWLSHPTINGGSFELTQALTHDMWPQGRFQIISDCLTYPMSRVEGVLRQVDQQLKYFI